MGILPKPGREEKYHHRFQVVIATVFLLAALVVGIYMLVGPHPEDPLDKGFQLFFLELPLFVILALIGVNALVRIGMGRKRGRR